MRNLNIGNLVAKYPIIQGGMGVGVSLSGLAAVANEEEELELFQQQVLVSTICKRLIII